MPPSKTAGDGGEERFDVRDLWRRSAERGSPSGAVDEATAAARGRSVFAAELATLPPGEHARIVYRVLRRWPHAAELVALSAATAGGFVVAVSSAHLVGARVSQHFRLVTRRPGGVGLVAALAGGLALYGAASERFVRRPFFVEQRANLCAPCFVTRQALCTLVASVALPLCLIPSYAFDVFQRGGIPDAPPRPLIAADGIFGTIAAVADSGRPFLRRYGLPLLLVHVGAALAVVYLQVWAFKRVLNTIEDDPQLFRQLAAPPDHSKLLQPLRDGLSKAKEFRSELQAWTFKHKDPTETEEPTGSED